MVVLLFYEWTTLYLNKPHLRVLNGGRKMAKTIEKIVLGIVVLLVLGIGSVLATALVNNKQVQTIPLLPSENTKVMITPKIVHEDITDREAEEKGDDNEIEEDEAVVAKELEQEGSSITEAEAIAIAMKQIDLNVVGEMTDVEVEKEKGRIVYAVEFSKRGVETDVKIDAKTGEVVIIESDRDEEEQD